MADSELTILVKARDDASRTLRGVGNQTKTLGSRFSALGTKMKSVGRVAFTGLAIGAVALGAGIKSAIDAASDLNESMTKSDVVFGKSAKAVQDWARTASTSMGQSTQQALEAAGTFGNLFRAMDFGVAPAAKMSTKLVSLAGDLASFNNADPKEVLMNLRSGLVGEAEPLRKFGVQLSAVRIEAEATRLGFKKVDGVFTASQKAQAAYNIILKDTTLAQGDFARTADGVANRQRIVAAQFIDMKAKIGQIFLPVWQVLLGFLSKGMAWFLKVLPSIQAFGRSVVDWFKRIWNVLKNNAVFKTVADLFERVVGFLGDHTSELKIFGLLLLGLAAGFVAVSVGMWALAPVVGVIFSPLVAVWLALAAAGVLIFKNWKTISQFFKTNIVPVFQQLKDEFTPFVKTIMAAAKNWRSWIPLLKKIWENIQPVVDIVKQGLIDGFKALVGLWDSSLKPALKDLWNALQTLWDPVLKAVVIGLGILIGVILIVAAKALPWVIKGIGFVIRVLAFLIKAIAHVIQFIGRLIGFFVKLGVNVVKVVVKIIQWWRELPGKIVGFVASLPGKIARFFQRGWQMAKGWLGNILTWFRELPGKAASFLSSLPGKIGNVFRDMIQTIKRWWNSLDIGIPAFNLNLPGPLPDIHFAGIGDIIPDVALAKGGLVRKPTVALLGERGPEVVTPLNKMAPTRVAVSIDRRRWVSQQDFETVYGGF